VSASGKNGYPFFSSELKFLKIALKSIRDPT
jgi:hypothetical protein